MKWWAAVPPYLAPRQIATTKKYLPSCKYSRDTMLGSIAGYSPRDRSVLSHLILKTGCVDNRLRRQDQTTGIIFTFEMFASLAATYTLWQQLTGRRLMMSIANEAACAARRKGAAKAQLPLFPIYSRRSVAAK